MTYEYFDQQVGGAIPNMVLDVVVDGWADNLRKIKAFSRPLLRQIRRFANIGMAKMDNLSVISLPFAFRGPLSCAGPAIERGLVCAFPNRCTF